MLEAEVQLARGPFRLEACFELGSGWTVLFGASGAGKTTMLRILSGLLAPDCGRIALRGRILTDSVAGVNVPPGQRRIGFVTQQSALFHI
jgi:molybdate transport system ATP-binding protein